jgi:spermidine/putrescine transport system ATP-binding protein
VAGFVGSNNRLAGKAVAVQGEIVEVLTRDGWSLRARRHGSIAVGAAVEAFVRPEATMLGRSAAELPADQPGHSGQVESLLFDGANSAVLLREQKSRYEFRIALPQTGQFADLKVGQQVFFAFDPERAICFSAADHG